MNTFKPTAKDFLTSCYRMSKEAIEISTAIKAIEYTPHTFYNEFLVAGEKLSGARLHLHSANADLYGLQELGATSDLVLMKACVAEAKKCVDEAGDHLEELHEKERRIVPRKADNSKEQTRDAGQAMHEREMQREREKSKERERQRM